jgi:hypothetical protein
MWSRFTALVLVLALPGNVFAGPIRESAEKAAKELAREQAVPETRGKGRFWTGIALLAGGGVLAALGSVELGDDEIGLDDGEDFDNSDDGEDSDGWGNKAMIGGGVAAATLGGVLLITGRKSGPTVAVKRGGASMRYTVKF